MNLTSLHLLLTYKCNLKCDHCFVWGSPHQNGLMNIAEIKLILQQAGSVATIRSIYFEGGEPFLYYPLLLEAVREADRLGFTVGIVTNAFWARSQEYALEKLKPFAGIVQDLSISNDLYHWSGLSNQRVQNASQAAKSLGIPVGTISISQPELTDVSHPTGQRPYGESGVMYRGRAAFKLAPRAPHKNWEEFDICPFENLRELGRVHVDPAGNVLICEGILLGNIFKNTLEEIFVDYDPFTHPVLSPLVTGGPAELVKKYNVTHDNFYADACHLCYRARQSLRGQFPDILAPARIYQEMQS